MDEELESLYDAIVKNNVPTKWSYVSYPSLKPLSRWLPDLIVRTNFFSTWLKCGPPFSYWLPSFMFPQGFFKI